jgi:hypothetical protein
MTLSWSRRSNRRLGAALVACLALVIAATAFVAGCGGSKKTAATSGGRSVQVLATVRRGNLVDTVIGRAQLTSTKGKITAVVQLAGGNASQVAAGQPVTLAFFRLPSGAVQGQNGQGFTPSAYPSPQGSFSPGAGGQGTFGQSGQGFFGQGGQGALRGKTAHGTVTSVTKAANGSITAKIVIAKLPAGVTAKSTGMAQIQVRVLASNVLIIPKAAIKGSGSTATVQIIVGGKTATRSVTVGQQTQTEAEITSGLSVGDNVVYMRTFNGRFPGFRNGQSGGQGYQQNGTAQQKGAPPSGAPFEGAPGGGQ